MKKELNATAKLLICGEKITSQSQISLSLQKALKGGLLLPKGEKFSLVGIYPTKGRNGNEYQSVFVELENKTQIPISIKNFNGIYYPFNPETKRNDTKTDLENPVLKSGKDIISFIDDNEDTIFIAKDGLQYQTLQFDSVDVVIPQTLFRFEEMPKK